MRPPATATATTAPTATTATTAMATYLQEGEDGAEDDRASEKDELPPYPDPLGVIEDIDLRATQVGGYVGGGHHFLGPSLSRPLSTPLSNRPAGHAGRWVGPLAIVCARHGVQPLLAVPSTSAPPLRLPRGGRGWGQHQPRLTTSCACTAPARISCLPRRLHVCLTFYRTTSCDGMWGGVVRRCMRRGG